MRKNNINSYYLFLKKIKNKNKIIIKPNGLNSTLTQQNKKDMLLNDTYYTYIYLHYGPICLKHFAIFYLNNIIIKNKFYSFNDAIYNDNLYEITIPSKLIIRIPFNSTYEFIKNSCTRNRLEIYYNNTI
jgi:hypothetical protein